MVFSVVCLRVRLAPLEFASDTVGRSITDNEFVIADGKLINDIAIPVSIPYILRAWLWFIPDFKSIIGISIDSMLLSKLIDNLLQVSGRV